MNTKAKFLVLLVAIISLLIFSACGTVEPTVSNSPSPEVEYTITFNSNGGSAVTAITQEAGTTVIAPVGPIKANNNFIGWYSNVGLTTSYTFTTMPSENITVYAKWSIVPVTYTITFNTNGGSVVAAITQEAGSAIVAPTAPTKTDFIFAGWYSNSGLTAAYTITTMPSENITIYAKWTENDPNKLTITGITFSNLSIAYDGTEKQILITGTLPNGVSVSYTNNSGTNAGTYNATATMTGSEYNTLVLNATLTITKINITGITFVSASYPYDNTAKELLITGTMPTGVAVEYTDNTGTNAGTYNASADLTGANYNSLSLDATLTITKVNLNGITFDSSFVVYDTQLHNIVVSGNLPAGANVAYTGGQTNSNTATDVGTYEITATITSANYNTLVLTATIYITAFEEVLYSCVFDGDVYFQNNLDNNKLYKYSESTLSKVNNDTPGYLLPNGSSLYYFSNGLLSSGIVELNGSDSDMMYTTKGEYLTTDGTYFYYAINNLLINTSLNGIYRVLISTDSNVDLTAERLTTDKASYLTVSGSYIYYSNQSDSGRLYRVSKTGGLSTLVYSYKVSDIIEDNEILYFTRHFSLSDPTLGAAIFKLDVSELANEDLPIEDETAKKITSSKGKNLVKIDNYIYFVNVDFAFSNLFGTGIYKTTTIESEFPGTAVVLDDENDKLFSMTSDGTYLYYYKLNDRHFYRCDIDGDNEIDLMEDFVVQETITKTLCDTRTVEYDGEIYYINPLDYGRLYKYNPEFETNYRVTTQQVADMAIFNGYLYYSTVFLMNYDLYRVALVNGTPERIATDCCMYFAFLIDKIYYINFSGSNSINIMNLDGTGDITVYEAIGIDEFPIYIYNNRLYFVTSNGDYDNELVFINLTGLDLSGMAQNEIYPVTSTNHYIDFYNITTEGIVYISDADGRNSIAKITLETNGTGVYQNIIDLNGTIMFEGIARDTIVIGDYIYYYRNNAADNAANKGFYRMSSDGSNPTLISNQYYLESMVEYDGKIYFINKLETVGDYELYSYDITLNTFTKIAF